MLSELLFSGVGVVAVVVVGDDDISPFLFPVETPIGHEVMLFGLFTLLLSLSTFFRVLLFMTFDNNFGELIFFKNCINSRLLMHNWYNLTE